jgi:hypothetical protein
VPLAAVFHDNNVWPVQVNPPTFDLTVIIYGLEVEGLRGRYGDDVSVTEPLVPLAFKGRLLLYLT